MTLLFEILDNDGNWQDVTSAVKSFSGGLGLAGQRTHSPGQGSATFVLNNETGAYSPSFTPGFSANLIEVRRRIRVRYTNSSQLPDSVLRVRHSGAADGAYFKYQNTATVTAGERWLINYWARPQFDRQFNAYRLQLVTSAEANPASIMQSYTNKWRPYRCLYVVTQNATWIEPHFTSQNTGADVTGKIVEFKNFSIQKVGSAPTNVAVGSWTKVAIGSPASDLTLSVVADSIIVWSGVIDEAVPAAFAKGARIVTLQCSDMFMSINGANVGVGIQKNKTMGELATSMKAAIPTGELQIAPGFQADNSETQFPVAFDGYADGQYALKNALEETAMSEYGRFWIDRDGTIRLVNRKWLAKAGLQETEPTLGQATYTSNPANNDTFEWGGQTYTFKTTLTPANYEVLIGPTLDDTMDNLCACISGGAGFGVKYANGTPDLFGLTATPSYEFPRRADIFGLQKITGNDGLPVVDTACLRNQYGYQNPPADGDSMAATALLDAGEYTVILRFVKTSDSARYDLAYSIDNRVTWVDIVTGQDLYNAVTTYNVQNTHVGMKLREPGYVTLRLKANGKNASSSGYKIAFISGLILHSLGE